MFSKNESIKPNRENHLSHLRYHNHPQQPVVNIVQQNIIVRTGTTPDNAFGGDDSDSETEAGSDHEENEWDFNEDDCMSDEDFERFLENWSEEQSVRAATAVAQPLAISLKEYNGLLPGMSVELLEDDFIRITEILQYINGEVKLRGYYFKKLNDLPSLFPKRDGELCWLVSENTDGSLNVEKEVAINDVQDVPTIHLTNLPWKEKVVSTPNSYVCRFIWQATPDKGEWVIRYLLPKESDGAFSVPCDVLRRRWRGKTTPYGSARKFTKDLTTAENPQMRKDFKLQRQYTFGDAFCGAGGVSFGAWRAGLRVKYGIDRDERACESYRINFPHSICYWSDFNSWIALQEDDELRVDISHSSPPCQTFSPAHTTSQNQQRDEENSSLIFTACDMIRKVRPRIHTLEETFGLATRHKDTFYAVLQGLLECGYSVHSKIVSCEKYGIPQTRKRLVIIAAGPGEKLPRFPAPTHGPGLQSYTTIQDVIGNIPRQAPDHSLFGTAFQNGMSRAPYDANTLAKTITCGGGEKNYHPSGRRHYTIRELARLQTFPDQCRFSSAYAKRQIGNAVPPRLVEVIYRDIVKSLQETDEEELAQPILIE